jgi:hypothetical protein
MADRRQHSAAGDHAPTRHSSITTTINTYGHLVPELDTTATQAVQRALARTG